MELEDLVAAYYNKLPYTQRETWVLDKVLMPLHISKSSVLKTYIGLLKGHNSNNRHYSIQILASISSLLQKMVSQNDKVMQGLWNPSWNYILSEITKLKGSINDGDPLFDHLQELVAVLTDVNNKIRNS